MKEKCVDGFRKAITKGTTVVIVDNKNVSMSDLEPYRMVCHRNDVSMKYVEFDCRSIKMANSLSSRSDPRHMETALKVLTDFSNYEQNRLDDWLSIVVEPRSTD